MTPRDASGRDRWEQVAAICDAALSLDAPARAAYLDRVCLDDPILRSEVDALLSRTGEARGFLSAPAAMIAVTAASPDLSGQRIGDFDVVARLGAGGMGVVYRAHDRTLGRDVALKVLPDDLANDPERLSRLRREAKLLAALSHANVGAIYGFVEANGKCALVLELLEGETLAAALARRPMSVAAALTGSLQILDALDHAHRRGITHRDLKPSNLMLTSSGIKLLDFGIGKLTLPRESRPPGFSTDTADGRIVGTPNYMAPEQLEGRGADARSDLFAFGALFHEMLSGRPVFAGDSQASIVAAVLTSTPTALTSSAGDPIPPGLDRIIAKCLEKDPEKRWQSARDLRDALTWIQTEPHSSRDIAPQRRPSTSAVIGVSTAVLAIAMAAGWASWKPRAPVNREVSRFFITAPANAPMMTGLFDVSPDGRQFVYRTQDSTRLMSRRLDEFETTVVNQPGGQPAISPDGQSIAISSKNVLYRKRLAGDGAMVPLAEIPGVSFDYHWSVPDTITFSGRDHPIRSVPSAGGAPTSLTTLASGETDHHSGQILPGGRAIVFAIHKPRNRFDVAVQQLGDTEHKVLIPDAYTPQYSPTGHLLFGRGTTLFAVPFDVDRLTTTGAPVTVVQNVATSREDGTMHYRVSTSGTLVYQPRVEPLPRTLVWMDRKGNETKLPLDQGQYEAPHVSPDGRAIVFSTIEPWRVWRYDIAAQRLTPLTPASEKSWGPIWSADGKAIWYARDRPDRAEIVVDRLDGSAPVVVGSSINDLWPTGFTADGTLITFEDPPTNNSWISRLVPGPNATPTAFADGPTTPFASRPSPDGLWVAFAADEGARLQLFVQPGSGQGVRRQITVDGGREAVWSRNGRELFFRSRNKVFALPVEPGKTLSWGRAVPLFDFVFANSDFTFDAAPDGRLLMVKGSSALPGSAQLNVVVNWAAELRGTQRPQ